MKSLVRKTSMFTSSKATKKENRPVYSQLKPVEKHILSKVIQNVGAFTRLAGIKRTNWVTGRGTRSLAGGDRAHMGEGFSELFPATTKIESSILVLFFFFFDTQQSLWQTADSAFLTISILFTWTVLSPLFCVCSSDLTTIPY